jgi:hypothetical protein
MAAIFLKMRLALINNSFTMPLPGQKKLPVREMDFTAGCNTDMHNIISQSKTAVSL